ncbi:HAD-IB family hydrolase [Patescibacteria group bacterium]|nr:HAD-IB family hydrolase [Patescibacteria group bacterium]
MSYVVFFDLDDTLLKGQSQKLLVKYLFQRKKVSVFFLMMIYFWFILYKLNLVKDVIKIREISFRICRGWNVLYTIDLLNDFFKDIKSKFYKDAINEINLHKEKDGKIILVSASLLPLVEIIRKYFSFDYAIATDLKSENGIFTGEIFGSVVYGENKKNLIKEFLKEKKISLKGSFAYSDHISDYDLFELADNPIVVNPNKKLFNIAKQKGWMVKIFHK